MRRFFTKEEKDNYVEMYKASGLTRVAFAKEFNLAQTSFCQWVREREVVEFKEVTNELVNDYVDDNDYLSIKINGYDIEFPISKLSLVLKELKNA